MEKNNRGDALVQDLTPFTPIHTFDPIHTFTRLDPIHTFDPIHT